jgi:hypothetical protein
MLKPYQVRVSATYQCLLTSLRILSVQEDPLKELISDADKAASGPELLGKPFPLKFQLDLKDSILVDFKGIAYVKETSAVSGGSWIRYGVRPETMKIPYFSNNVPAVSVKLPDAYIIPPEWQTVIAKLALHGIRTRILATPEKVVVHTYYFTKPKWQANPYEGRHPLTQVTCEEVPEVREFPAGSVIVETGQPEARIIAHLLEPQGNGSLVFWGFFDAIFEQKEYAESYVMEKLAEEMLAENLELREELAEKKSADSAFANSPGQVLNWFYQRSPYADSHRNVYPIGRIMDPSTLTEAERHCLP